MLLNVDFGDHATVKKGRKSSWPAEPMMLKFEIAATIRRMMKRVSDSGRGERDEEK
jgi:hypothetical protein